MPKVNRNKQHTDFSLLLSELQGKDKDTGNATLTSSTKAIEPSILIVIHHLKQEEKQRSTIIGAFLYRIKLTLYTNGYHSHSKLKQTVQGFHIVRTPNETPNENGLYCIVYKSNTVYAYNIGVFDTQKQSFTKSYSKDLITNIANVVAWKKL